MPRSNRRRDDEHVPLDGDRLLSGWRRTVRKHDGEWTLQPMTGSAALKAYVCPGCHRQIPPGTAHLVAWRNDGIFGEAQDVAERRHWHSGCWETKP